MAEPNEITPEMWRDWVESPVTKAVFAALKDEKNRILERIPSIDPSNTHELMSRVMRLQALEDILEIELGEES